MSIIVRQIIWIAILAVAGAAWLLWRKHQYLLEHKPWRVHSWASRSLLPPSQSSLMQEGLREEAKSGNPNVVVVFVRELQPGDKGWIQSGEIRQFGGHLWLDPLSRVCSEVRMRNQGWVEIEVDEEGILVNVDYENVPEMSEVEKVSTDSAWYHADAMLEGEED